MNQVTQIKRDKTAKDYVGGMKVVDTDTHITEWPELWTSRATGKWKNLVPRVVEIDGKGAWVMGEDHILNRTAGFSAIKKDKQKAPGVAFRSMCIEDIHPGAYDVHERVKYMDENGIAAQIAYTNLLGFGGQKSMTVEPELRLVATQILNDALAEMQEQSNNRIYPMAMMPWWDIDVCVKEAERCANMGMRGVNMNAGPHSHGLPHLDNQYWQPLWDLCQDRSLPVNFHIGSSDESMSWYGSGYWDNFSDEQKMAYGSIMLFSGNFQVLVNIFLSGMLERNPKLKIVSVESGLGWINFMLEALDYHIVEQNGLELKESMVETFRRHIYICGWYEHRGFVDAIKNLGADNLLFETDFPHPTCLYPNPVETAVPMMENMSPEDLKKVFQTNAEKLYNLDLRAAPAFS